MHYFFDGSQFSKFQVQIHRSIQFSDIILTTLSCISYFVIIIYLVIIKVHFSQCIFWHKVNFQHVTIFTKGRMAKKLLQNGSVIPWLDQTDIESPKSQKATPDPCRKLKGPKEMIQVLGTFLHMIQHGFQTA